MDLLRVVKKSNYNKTKKTKNNCFRNVKLTVLIAIESEFNCKHKFFPDDFDLGNKRLPSTIYLQFNLHTQIIPCMPNNVAL